MSWTRFLRRRHWDEERARELEAYLEAETDENIARGMPPEEARFAAHRKLGNTALIREEIYRMNSLNWLGTLWQDLRFALRILRRNPGFAVVTALTLALGIGGTVVVFSLLDAVLLRPLPHPQQDRLFRVFTLKGKRKAAMEASSYPDFRDWQRQSRMFESLAAYEGQSLNLTGTAEPERLDGATITPGLFATLGVRPVLGREFAPDDDERVAMLSYQLWQRRFGADRGVIGKPIHLDGRAYTVVGVLPPQLRFRPYPAWDAS